MRYEALPSVVPSPIFLPDYEGGGNRGRKEGWERMS